MPPQAATSDLGPSFAVKDAKGKTVGNGLYRAQHGGMELEPVARDLRGNATGLRARVTVECKLDWYWKRMTLNDRQYAAGMRFRALFHAAHAEPRLTANYASRIPGGDASHVETTRDARTKMLEAIRTTGLATRDAITDVCGLDNWATERLPLLREGLTQLADYWRLSAAE